MFPLVTGADAALFVDSLTFPLPDVYAIATGDFDGDGRIDVAAMTYSRNAAVRSFGLYVLYGRGDGGLESPALIWTETTINVDQERIRGCNDLIAADFNRDGRTDLLARTAGGVGTVFLPSAGRTLSVIQPDIALFCRTYARDLDRDGVPDLVDSDGGVALGNGDGTFRPGIPIPLLAGDSVAAIGDFDGDGILDVAFSDDAYVAGILPGRGDGTFLSGANRLAFATLREHTVATASTGVGDFNGDGKLDLATFTHYSTGQYLGSGDGRFGSFAVRTGVETMSLNWLKAPAVADLRMNGTSDLLVIAEDLDSIVPLGLMFVGLTATDPLRFVLAFIDDCCYGVRDVAIADLDNDGKPDVIVADAGYGDFVPVIRVYLNTTDVGSTNARDYVQAAYIAYYGRPADPGGLTYWVRRMDAEGGSLNAIVAAFGASAEFGHRYGGMSDAVLVTEIYRQSLGRDPDAEGLAWYVGELRAGRRTLQSIALDVLNGATTAPDATVVANKRQVAAYYTARVAAGCWYGNEREGVSALARVTSARSSVAAARIAIATHCGS